LKEYNAMSKKEQKKYREEQMKRRSTALVWKG
jgi:teichoic acid transport system ATP-binding protein